MVIAGHPISASGVSSDKNQPPVSVLIRGFLRRGEASTGPTAGQNRGGIRQEGDLAAPETRKNPGGRTPEEEPRVSSDFYGEEEPRVSSDF